MRFYVTISLSQLYVLCKREVFRTRQKLQKFLGFLSDANTSQAAFK